LSLLCFKFETNVVTVSISVTEAIDVVVEDFETGNLDSYTFNSGGGSMDVTTNRPRNGTYSLEMKTSGSGSHDSLVASTVQSEDVYRGKVFRVYFYRGNQDSRGRFYFRFGRQDSSNLYEFYSHFDKNDTIIRKRSDDSYVKSDNAGVSPPRNSWEWVEIDWDSSSDGVISVDTSWISNKLSITDTEWDQGQYEIRTQCASNVTTWVDDIEQV